MERAVVGVTEQPGVAPGLIAPAGAVEEVVPARVGFDHRVAWMLRPGHEVVGDGEADALNQALLAAADSRVEHVPAAVVVDGAAGPGRKIVPASLRSRLERVG